jgi:hypothetical protein
LDFINGARRKEFSMAVGPPPPSPPRQAAPAKPDIAALGEELFTIARRLIVIAGDVQRAKSDD